MRISGWWVAGLLSLVFAFMAGISVSNGDGLPWIISTPLVALIFWGISHMHDDIDSLARERRGLMKKAAKLDKKVAALAEREEFVRRLIP